MNKKLTKPLYKVRNAFYFFQKEKDLSLPRFVFPAIWWERKRQGLEIAMTRVSVGLWYYRWHWYFGSVSPIPSESLTSNAYSINEFISWMNQWCGSRVERANFDSWLLQSEWKTLVRWGGARYHYSKILLAKEFLNDAEQSENPIVGPDQMDLTLTMDDAPPLSTSHKK